MNVRTSLRASFAVVLALATVGSFAAGFGTMTACTNEYRCTATGCPPCATASAWLTTGWIAQGLLLLVGVALAVLAHRGVRLPAVRGAALALGPLALVLFLVTTVGAGASY